MTDEPDPRPNPRPRPLEPDQATNDRETPPLVSAGTSSRRRRSAGEVADEPVGRATVPAAPPQLPPEPPYDDEVFDDDGESYPDEWVTLPKRSGPLRRATIILVVLGLIVGVTGFSVLRWVNNEIHPPGDPGKPVAFTIEQGNTTNVIANNLASAHVIGNATVFRYWLRRQGGDTKFKAGDYDLQEHMDYPELLAKLREGPKPPVSLNVTVLPGLTIAQMKARLLETLKGFDGAEFDQALARSELDKPWVPPLPFPIREGILFPDTYQVDEEAASNEYALIKRMSDKMDQVLGELGAEEKAAALGRSVYEVVIVASLVEEEAKVDADRPKIARVIYNRLDRDMPLGIDATTRYGVGKLNAEPLLQSDLDSDSPYNTRNHKGLPPTPIALPTRASLEAALNPTPNERWLYYVLTNEDGVEGAHTFATTSREFEAAKQVCIERNLGCG
jgi:UPF0755 protein